MTASSLLSASLLAFIGLPIAIQDAQADVIVALVKANTVDEPSRIEKGDRLHAARTESGRILALETTLTWRQIELELLPLGPITVIGEHNGKPRQWRIADREFEITVHPVASNSDAANSIGPLAERDAALRVELLEKDYGAAEALYAEILQLAADATPTTLALLQLSGYAVAFEQAKFAEATAQMDSALALDVSPLLRAELFDSKGLALLRAGRYADAAAAERSAIELRQEHAPDSVALGRSLARLTNALRLSHDNHEALIQFELAQTQLRAHCSRCRDLSYALFNGAVAYYELDRRPEALGAMRESTEILHALDGDTLDVGKGWVNLAIFQRINGDFEQAEAAVTTGLRIYEKLNVPELQLATALIVRGTIAMVRGDLQSAEQYYARTQALLLRLEPEGVRMSDVLHNLGVIAQRRGDLARAREYLRRSYTLLQRLGDSDLHIAREHYVLGNIEEHSGNLELAMEHFVQARDLQEKINPDGHGISAYLMSIGAVLTKLGRMEEAEKALTRAVAINELLPTDCFCRGPALRELAWFELSRQQPQAALTKFRRAYQLMRNQAPNGEDVAQSLLGIGESQLAMGDAAKAQRAFEQAASRFESDSPDNPMLARAWYGLGRSADLLRKPQAALDSFCCAAAVLDRASTRVGGGNRSESMFRSQYADVYRACLTAKLDSGDPIGAFGVLERSRARGFLNSLEQRELHFGKRAPSALLDTFQRNRRDQAALVEKLADIHVDATKRRGLQSELAVVRNQGAQLFDQLAEAAPALANLLKPQVPELSALQAALPDDAVLFSYSVGDKQTLLFRLNRHSLDVLRIDAGRARLASDVASLRALIGRRDPSDLDAIQDLGARLFDLLIRPALADTGSRRRLLISPDGPLHDLPFAALWDTGTPGYLIERATIELIDSLASSAALAKASEGRQRLLAIGDPHSDGAGPAAALRSAWPDLVELPPLPAARREVTAIASLYGDRSDVLLGANASESQTKARAPSVGVLHLAVHALLNNARPLDSALVLRADPGSTGPTDDGLLQAWEIFDELSLDADLVVLSACETAQGKELRGEGLLGFTRAFEFAGARHVLASLWRVEDAATAELMEAFYRARVSGQSDSDALRDAALALIHGDSSAGHTDRGAGGLVAHDAIKGRARHPFYWAAFQLHGTAH